MNEPSDLAATHRAAPLSRVFIPLMREVCFTVAPVYVAGGVDYDCENHNTAFTASTSHVST